MLADESTTELLKRTNKNAKKEKKLSKEQIAEIESIIDADRRKLEEQKELEVEQRDEIKVIYAFTKTRSVFFNSIVSI